MKNLKNISITAIQELPDTCTLEEIMYKLNLIAQVLEGVNDAENGRVLTTEEVLKRIEKWGK